MKELRELQINVRLTAGDDEDLVELAARLRRTKSDALRHVMHLHLSMLRAADGTATASKKRLPRAG